MTNETVKEYPFFVGGEWRKSTSPSEIRSPYDGNIVALVHRPGPADLDDAVFRAENSFDTIRGLSSSKRSRLLDRLADHVEERFAELSSILVYEGGKTRSFAAAEARRAVLTLRISAEEARRIGGEVIDLDWTDDSEGRIGVLRRFPIGPVLGITPFNFPLNLACHKLGPAIAAGNPIILKPASATPISSLLLAEMAESSGFPEGALSVLPCSGNEAESLVKDPRIPAISFTGSAEIGWRLKGLAGRKKVTLELGGNSAVIVHDDCHDLAYAAGRIVTGGFSNAGQVCISVQRVLVQDNIYEEILSMILSRVRALKTGNPDSDETDVGPLINQAAAERVEGLVAEAVREGAEVRCGGKRNGNLFTPTVITKTGAGMKIEDEEAFSPLITVSRYTGFDEALARATNSQYGLQLGVFTNDIGRILHTFETARVGGVVINDIPGFRVDHMPYGGAKGSGTGKEGPRWAIRELTEERLLIMNRRGG
jgi:acyl-CoA reductase-like NAD-dependent aldehyde dehydrogenase